MATNTDVHTCSYYCERPECVRRQRDELRDRMESALAAQQPAAVDGAIDKARRMKPLGAQKGVVAWARLVYARPVNAPEPAEEWDEVVDIEFHNRPEKPEGEGWRPLVLADTGDGGLLNTRLKWLEDMRDAGAGNSLTKENVMDKPIPEAVLEAVARAICVACEENPDRRGDARGNKFRWQDYRDVALAAISAFTAAQQPTEGEEIMVNTPHGVFILPLHPSGLSSGPRFVVYVPELSKENSND